MGNLFGYSCLQHPFTIGKSKLNMALETAYPSYYIADVVINDSDIDYVTRSWNKVMNCEEVEEFLKAKQELNFEYSSCLTWFFDLFYGQFFVLCPDARPMFVHVSMAAQGRLLAGVISTALGLIKKPDKLRKRLIGVVDSHNPKKIYASYYGVMGEALLWALHRVLGSKFDDCTKTAWQRVYSMILSIMIPRAIAYEIKYNSNPSSASLKSQSSFKSTTSSSGSNKSISNVKYRIETQIRNSLTLRRTRRHRDIKSTPNQTNTIPECPFKLADNKSKATDNDDADKHNKNVNKHIDPPATEIEADDVLAKNNDDCHSTLKCPFKLPQHTPADRSHVTAEINTNNNDTIIIKKASSAFGRLIFHSSAAVSSQGLSAPDSGPGGRGRGRDGDSVSNVMDKPSSAPPKHQHFAFTHAHHPHVHDNKILPSYPERCILPSSGSSLVTTNPKLLLTSKSSDDHVVYPSLFQSPSLTSRRSKGIDKPPFHLPSSSSSFSPYSRVDIDSVGVVIGTIGTGGTGTGTAPASECPYQFESPATVFQPHHSTTPLRRNNDNNSRRKLEPSLASTHPRSYDSYDVDTAVSHSEGLRSDALTFVLTDPQGQTGTGTGTGGSSGGSWKRRGKVVATSVHVQLPFTPPAYQHHHLHHPPLPATLQCSEKSDGFSEAD